MSRERYQARSKKVQKLGRDGLVEQDRATGEDQRVSQRTADVSFGPERPARQDTESGGARPHQRRQIRKAQSNAESAPERANAPDAPTPERPAAPRGVDDTPFTPTPPAVSGDGDARHGRQQTAAHHWFDTPQRLTFEQPASGGLQFEPGRDTTAADAPGETETDAPRDLEAVRPRDTGAKSAPRHLPDKTGKRTPQQRRAQERSDAPAPEHPKAERQKQAAQHSPDAAASQRHRLRFEDAPQTADSPLTQPRQQKRYRAAIQTTRETQGVQSKPAAPLPAPQPERPRVHDTVRPRRLRFEEETPKEPRHAVTPMQAARTAALMAVHDKAREAEDGNVAVEAAHEGEIVTERGAGVLRQNRSRRQAASRVRATGRANPQPAQTGTARRDRPQFTSNPVSRWQQKRAIQRQYAAAKRAGTQTAATAYQSTAKVAEATRRKSAAFVRRHRKGFLIIGVIALVLALCSSMMTSCSTLMQGGMSAVTATTYPSEDADMLAAEAWYAAKEAELQVYLDTYEATHAYHEYHYALDDIEHDPYVLISALTALRGGAWTFDEVRDTLQMLFDRQYILTETVTTETRTRTVDGEEQEYTYYICTVTLENFNLSHVPVYVMSEEQLSMYAMYMGTLGNRPDLFPTSGYIGRYLEQGYTDYEIPASALEDETFAAMIAEAEKYLGYPYVWGGSNPNTSFDCSGFISWIINHSGGNVGRLGAQSLFDLCTPTSDPRPGDLIFFTGTFAADTPVTHVGLYVGDGWMIHAGDPISYANVNSNYFRAHFYAYGRLP